MKQIAILAVACCTILQATAQISITGNSRVYTQDFDALDTQGLALTKMPAGWNFKEWGGSTVNTTYRAGNGNSNIGDTYSFGLTASADRSLGSLCSGSGNPSTGVPNVCYGVTFLNSDTVTIGSLTITFKEEQWRRGGSGITDSVLVYYSTVAGSSVADTTFSSWTRIPSLLMTSIARSPAAGAINGNDSSRVLTATVPVSIPVGGAITLRWYDFNSIGSDDGLAIDSLTVVFTPAVPVPPDYHPHLITQYPTPNAGGLPISGALINLGFDRNVVAGTGNIYLKNRNSQITLTIPASGSNLATMGKSVTISSIGLLPDVSYHVTFDSTAFDTAGYNCTGLYDTTVWRFSTAISQSIPGLEQQASLIVSVTNQTANNGITIIATLQNSGAISAAIYDVAGRQRLRQKFFGQKGENRFAINTMLPAGIYILHLQNSLESGNARFIIE